MSSAPVKVRSERDPDFYSSGGWGYDRHRDAHRRRWRERYVEAFDLRPYDAGEPESGQTRVLDAGCGDGFWASFFFEGGFDTSAFDLSEDGIQVARMRYPGPAYVQADAERELPFPRETFDVLFCRGITHAGRPRAKASIAVMGNLVEYLRPGGLAVVTRSTNGSGIDGPSSVSPGARAANPTADDLRAMVEPWLAIERVDVYPNEVVIGGRK